MRKKSLIGYTTSNWDLHYHGYGEAWHSKIVKDQDNVFGFFKPIKVKITIEEVEEVKEEDVYSSLNHIFDSVPVS